MIMEKILFSLVNLFMLLTLLYFFTKRPVRQYMKKRSIDFKEKKVGAEIEYRGQERQSAALTEKIHNVNSEIKQLFTDAESSGAKKGAKLLAEAEKVADRIIEQSMARVDNEIKRRGRMFVEQMVDDGMKSAESSLRANLTKDRQMKIAKAYVKKFAEERIIN